MAWKMTDAWGIALAFVQMETVPGGQLHAMATIDGAS
jgi:hypothetical protein